MAPASAVRLAVAALAVVVLASCSGSEPEAVSAGGGIELSSTTTEQPRNTEPGSTTTSTTTSSTTTTSTTTTTTAPEPVGPTLAQLTAALPPAETLPGEGWTRDEAPTEVGGAPSPLCEGSTVATPLRGVVAEVSIADGVSARYQRADGRSTVQLVLAPLPDVEERLAEARTEVAACPDVAVLEWPPQGDGSLAFAQPATATTDGTTWSVTRVGKVVVGLNLRSAPADGTEAAPPPDEAALQAFVQSVVAGLASVPTG